MNQKESSQKTPNQTPKKSLIPWIFVAFFSVIFIVDFSYMYVAEKTWRGLVTDDSYQKGLNYNQTIGAFNQQKQLGWSSEIYYDVVASKSGNLRVKLVDKNGHIIKDATVVANIKRPVQEGYDFSVPLVFNKSTSNYQAKINFPLIGQWAIEIVASKNSDSYQDGKRLIIR